MKSRNFALFGLSILAVVVLMGLASAATLAITNVIYPASINEGTTFFVFSFNLTNSGADANVSFDSSTTSKGTISIPMLVDLSENQSVIVNGTITGISATATGAVNVLIYAHPTEGNNKTSSFSTSINATIDDFCEGTANEGDLSVTIKDINTLEGFGDNEKYWYPFDEVEIKLKVENNGDWDIQNADIEICLYDVDTGKCIYDEGDMDLSEDSPDIDSGDDVTITATFIVNPDDLDGGDEDYVIYAKATGEIDDKDSAFDGDNTCSSDSQDKIEIRTSENFVLLGNLDYSETVPCGSDLIISADVWNLDDSKAKDVVVNVYNKELGLDEDVEIGDISDFDSEAFDFSFTIPSSATEKHYSVVLTVLDDDGDVYQNSEDDDSVFPLVVTVEGNCATSPTTGSVVVSASIQSGGQAGKDLVIKASVTNTGTTSATYALSAAGYGSWASSASLSQTSLTLAAGQSQDVLVTLAVKNDASGDNSFNLEVLSGGQLVLSQPVSVTISGAGFNLSGLFGNNWYLWLIGAINVILVVVIIVVAVRVLRKE